MVMERKFLKKYDQIERKTDSRFVKDRGDNIRKNDKQWNRRPDEDQRRTECDVTKIVLPDRGDSQMKADKHKTDDKAKADRIGVTKVKERQTKEVDKETPRLIEQMYRHDIQKNTYADWDRRKRIREKYTIINRNNNASILNRKEDLNDKCECFDKADIKIDQCKKQVNSDTCHKSIQHSWGSEEFASSKFGNEACNNETPRRKPLIKSIIKSDMMRRYKAVTVVDQKQRTTPLQIDINRELVSKQKIAKFADTLNSNIKTTASKLNVKEKRYRQTPYRPKRKYRKTLSPDSMCRKNICPPTEVAKWAPNCLDQHTKPYYEAWISTTLAAINKCSKKDKLYAEKQNIIKQFRKMLEAPSRISSPELKYEDYNNDEMFTGRIKIRQGQSKRRS